MKHTTHLITILLTAPLLGVSSFSASTPTKAAPWQFLKNLIPQNNGANNKALDVRAELKSRLYTECRSNFGKSNGTIRKSIECIIEELSDLNPTEATAGSPLLMKEWRLEWTTEKEINFFLQNNISNAISQTLSNGILENYIPFVKGGGFGVTGNINPDKKLACRTEFTFTKAKLDLGKWGAYEFPPVGKGWFDTIYLDDELRIDTNSRNDILICTAER